MYPLDEASYILVAARVTKLVEKYKIEEGYWPGLTEVFYRSANEGILRRTIESLRFVRRLALSG